MKNCDTTNVAMVNVDNMFPLSESHYSKYPTASHEKIVTPQALML